MRDIKIIAFPNQSLSINVDDVRYDIEIKATRGLMSVSIARDNIWLVRGERMVAGTPLFPYQYLMEGNFFLITENESYPDYTQFGITQKLVYLTAAEVEAFQTSGFVEASTYVPSLSFDFVVNQSITSSEGFEADFTRASQGSYYDSEGVINFAANDIPRFDYNPETLEAEGLLIESAGTNICPYSEQFNDASWTKTNSTISSNSAVAPDGLTTADAIIDNITNGVHTASRSLSFVSGSKYTFSIFLKAGDRTCAKISLPASAFPGTPYCFVNLSTGVLGTPSGCTAKITNLQNEWFRFEITATADASTTGDITIGTALDLTTDSYAGDGGEIYAWGSQVEVAPYATSYIQTTTTSATRAVETLNLESSGWLADQVGTFYAQATLPAAGIAAARVIAELNDETANNVLAHYIDGTDGDKRKSILKSGGVTEFSYSRTAYGFAAPVRFATAYKENAVIGAIDGILSTFDDDAEMPDFTNLTIGSAFSGSLANGWIREVQYYPEYLPNSVLRGMTQ